jgi:hypothetical protein
MSFGKAEDGRQIAHDFLAARHPAHASPLPRRDLFDFELFVRSPFIICEADE